METKNKTFLKDCLHLYIGQQCLYARPSGGAKETIDESMVAHLNQFGGWDLCKPILRNLVDMTDAEHDGWNKISTIVGEMHIQSAINIHWEKRLAYYRSIGIDADGLIATGQAVDASALPNRYN